MSALHVRIEGKFEDCTIYMGQLFAVTADNVLLTASLEEAIAAAAGGRVPPLLQFFLLRNDALTKHPLDAFQTIPGISRALRQAADKAGTISLQPAWLPVSAAQRAFADGAALDINIYRRRMYISTTADLSHFDFDVTSGEVEARQPVRRLDTGCISTVAKFGTMVASCGAEGIFAAYDDFEDISPRDSSEPIALGGPSLRASWISYSLASYADANTARFLSGERQKVYDNDGKVYEQLVHLQSSPSSSSYLAELARDSEFIFNSSDTFLTHRGMTYELHKKRVVRGELTKRETTIGRGRIDRILSAHAFPGGIVAETFDDVRILRPKGSKKLHSGPAIKVRTFPNSNWATNLVAVVDEDGIHLYSPADG